MNEFKVKQGLIVSGNTNLYGTLSISGKTLVLLNNSTLSGDNSGDQAITLSGDVLTSTMVNGTYMATLPNITTGGTFNNVTFNAKGQVISGYTTLIGDGILNISTSGIGLSGNTSFSANQASGTTIVISSNATSDNNPNTIVSRDSNGNFSGISSSATTVLGTIQNSIVSIPNLSNVGVITGGTWTSDIILKRNQTSSGYTEGTIFFDEVNETAAVALSNGVTLQLGQEEHLYAYADENILNGQAVYINGSRNGLPCIKLAISSDDIKSVVAGIATTNISSGSTGFITVRGLVHDLTINDANIGDILYLSDTVLGGYTNKITNFNSRINKIGYLVSTGTNLSIIYVNISNENTITSLTEIEKSILVGNSSSTGCYEFSGITKTSSTTFSISPLKGWIINNTYLNGAKPIVEHIFYTGGTNLITPYINTAFTTYILVNSGSTLTMQNTYPTPEERRRNIYIGKAVHSDNLSISVINNTTDFDVSPLSVIRDMFTPLKLINDGITLYPNGNNLNFNISAGDLYGIGINWVNNQLNPDKISISPRTPTTFYYRNQTGATYSLTSGITPSVYDLNGTITIIPTNGDGQANRSTNQRVYIYPTGNIYIQYGQKVYESLALALAGQQTESFIKAYDINASAILLGIISVRRTATNLSDTNQAIFVPASMFGESVGGVNGISTTSLQQAYDNSIIPQIITNTILDGVVIQQGSGNDTDKVFGINNGAGIETFKIIGNGSLYISGNTLFTVPFLSGYTGNNGEILVGSSSTTAPTWKTLSAAGIAPSTGSTSITRLGTITGGTWQGSIISSIYGGTGLNNSGNTLNILADSSISGTNSGDNALNNTALALLTIQDTNWITGFVNTYDGTNVPDTILSFNTSTKIFTITPTGTSYSLYSKSVKYTKTGDTVNLTSIFVINTMIYVFYDSTGVLSASTTDWDMVSSSVPVATVLWNGTASFAIISDERHSFKRNNAWHNWAHENIGSKIKSGFDIISLTSSGTTISSGIIVDEDIQLPISEQINSIRIVYKTGSTLTYNDNLSSITAFVSGSTLMFDNGGTPTQVTSGYYIRNVILATNSISGAIACRVAQTQWNNINDARKSSPPVSVSYLSNETRELYSVIWQNIDGVATLIEYIDYRIAPTLPNGFVAKTPTYLTELKDTLITSPNVDDVLKWNGFNYVMGNSVTSSGTNGVEFFPDSTDITSKTTENLFSLETLSKTPVTTTENIDAINCNNNTVIGGGYLYNTALGRTVIDAGTWSFDYYLSVSSTIGGRVSTLTNNIYEVLPYIAISGTTTLTGATRTFTASSGTPFADGKIAANASNLLASYIQTPKGVYQITEYISDTQVTIATPITYVNETNISFSVWKLLFGVKSPTITNITTNYGLYAINSVQSSFNIDATSKLGMIVLATSNNTTTVNYVYNGQARYSHFSTPLITLHNNLAGVQGLVNNEAYHIPKTSADSLALGVSGSFTSLDGKSITVTNGIITGIL